MSASNKPLKQQCDFKQKPPKMSRKAKKRMNAAEEVRQSENAKKLQSKPLDVLSCARKLGALMKSRALRYAQDIKQPTPQALTSWFKVDAKESPPPVYDYTKDEVVMSEISAIRTAVRMAYGLKPIKVEIPAALNLSSTVTTGVVNTVATLDVSNTLEYGALASLFDEYRTRGFEYEFWVPAVTPTFTLTSGATSTSDNMLTISYDPADSTAVGSSVANMQQAQRIVLAPRTIMTGTASTFCGSFQPLDAERPFRFKVAIAPVAEVLVNAGTATTPGMWKPSSAGTLSDGYIKPYLLSGFTTASVAIAGILRIDTEWRSRS